MDEAVNHDQSNSFAISLFTRMYQATALKRRVRCGNAAFVTQMRPSLSEQTFERGKLDEDGCSFNDADCGQHALSRWKANAYLDREQHQAISDRCMIETVFCQ